MDGVHKDEGADRFQGPVLPRSHLRHDLLRDLCRQLRRYLYVVQLLDLLGDILLAHTAGVKTDDLFLHTVRIPAVLADDFRLKCSSPFYFALFLPLILDAAESRIVAANPDSEQRCGFQPQGAFSARLSAV